MIFLAAALYGMILLAFPDESLDDLRASAYEVLSAFASSIGVSDPRSIPYYFLNDDLVGLQQPTIAFMVLDGEHETDTLCNSLPTLSPCVRRQLSDIFSTPSQKAFLLLSNR